MKTIRYFLALFGMNMRVVFALRGTLLAQALFMMVNNFLFLSVWWVFFQRVDNINGYQLKEMALLYATSATSFGLTLVFFGGVQTLCERIERGDLDVWLVQPKPILVQALASHSNPSGWGDILSGIVLFGLTGALTDLTATLLALSFALSGLVVYVAWGILSHSIAFWMGSTRVLSGRLFETMLTFTLYPDSIYGAVMRFVLFSLIPAGLISFVPARAIRESDLSALLPVYLGAAVFGLFAVSIFQYGLRRYSSGSGFGHAN